MRIVKLCFQHSGSGLSVSIPGAVYFIVKNGLPAILAAWQNQRAHKVALIAKVFDGLIYYLPGEGKHATYDKDTIKHI